MGKWRVLAGAVLVFTGLAALGSQNWSFGKPLPVFEKRWTFAAGELRDLHVHSDYNVTVTFAKSGDSSNSVFLKGQGREKMIREIKQTELSGGRLELDLREPAGLLFSFIHSNQAKEEIVVTLAEGFDLDNLGLQLDSDSLTVTDAKVKTADISADSGTIEIRNLTAHKLNMTADSGSVKGEGIHADSTISADSGSIMLTHLTGPVRLSADSGRVNLYRDDSADTDIKADSGSVYLSLPASFAGSFDLQADSGTIIAPDPKRQTKDFVKVRSDSGSIEIVQGE